MPVNLRPAPPADASPPPTLLHRAPRAVPHEYVVPEGLDNYDVWRAAEHGKIACLNFYLDRYPQQCTRLSHRAFAKPMYPLALAARHGQYHAVKLLVEELPGLSVAHRGVRFNVDSLDPSNKTALMHAIDKDEKRIVRLLLNEGGANPSRPHLGVKVGFFSHKDFSNALMYAVYMGARGSARELMKWEVKREEEGSAASFNKREARAAALKKNDRGMVECIDAFLPQEPRPRRRRRRTHRTGEG